jgi:hypothetical protein
MRDTGYGTSLSLLKARDWDGSKEEPRISAITRGSYGLLATLPTANDQQLKAE